MNKKRLLWVDDEIELLRSHVIFLTDKGYEVDTVTNGQDAVEEVKRKNYDLIFLDEMMAGMGGLETLSKIKDINPNIPVVMVTKNEEESLMNDAIGGKITDYLIKPVLPSQILMTCKKILDQKKISGEYVAKDYLQDFASISRMLLENLDFNDWVEIYLKLVNWEMELDAHPEVGLRQTLIDQKKECNQEFSRYIEANYQNWLKKGSTADAPDLTPDILDKYLFDEIRESNGPVFLFVIDCLRYDQWLIMENHLKDYFNFSKNFYCSILPTATPYARNSLFSGLYPSEIEKVFPGFWKGNDDDENSMNKYEKELLQELLNRKRIKLKTDLKFIKIIDPDVGRSFEQNIHSHKKTHFMSVVVNFLDMVAHGRSDSEILQEISPDEPAYRSLTNSWFMHSSLFNTFKVISGMPGAKVFITTDHGSIRAMRAAKVIGDREASTGLRFKFGRNLKVDEKHALFIKNPEEYKLPYRGLSVSYIISKEDFYFIYPTEYHKFQNYYKDTFQHGGISMEEMILPVIKMVPKK